MNDKVRAQKRSSHNVSIGKSSSERIHKYLAQLGYGSRRQIEQAIIDGKIIVNSLPAVLGQQVSNEDQISFDGKLVGAPRVKNLPRVILYHKPEGEIVTVKDPKGRPTVYQKLPKIKQAKWIAIGRLDFNTSGLLIFTSSGELANKLMHPRYGAIREYSVRILGDLTEEQGNLLCKGIKLEDGIAKFESLSFEGGERANKWYKVSIKEGRNREVRRMFEYFDIKVSRLIRIRFGPLSLPNYLKRGMHEELSQKHTLNLLSACEIDTKDFRIPQRIR